MSIQVPDYTAPEWANNTSPYIEAESLQNISDTLESIGGTEIPEMSDVETGVRSNFFVGMILLTATNTNPGTIIGGTWVQIAQGRCLIGVGAGTDKNSITKTYAAGNDSDGEYQHTLTTNEIPAHTHTYTKYNNDTGCAAGTWGFHADSSPTTTRTTSSTGGGQAFNMTQPSFGVYVWQRTA